jgi:hypothetical protein
MLDGKREKERLSQMAILVDRLFDGNSFEYSTKGVIKPSFEEQISDV